MSLSLALAAVTLAAPALISQAADGACEGEATLRAYVLGIDEHLDLTLDDGTRLKLAGIEPPRPTPGDPGLDARVQGELAGWLLGQEIAYRLAEPGKDRWGRHIAFAYAADAQAQEPLEARRLPVNEALIDAGLARYEPSAAARPCRSMLLAAEKGARAERLGLWADPYYAIIEAGAREGLSERAGSIVIVEGPVTGLSTRGLRITLFLGPRKGLDFSVTLSPPNRKAFETAYASLAGLAGRRVRVRGFLDTRFGPHVEISSPDAVEVAEQNDDAAAVAPPGR